MTRAVLTSLLLSAVIAAAGCSHVTPRGDYRTVVANPHRDTERAQDLNRRAVRHIEKERLDKAEELLQDALIADVSFGPAHNNLGHVYFAQRKLYLAAWEFEYASRLMSDRAEPINNLGMVYEAAFKYDEAVNFYLQAHQREPANGEYLGNLVRTMMRRGDDPVNLRDLVAQLVFVEQRPDWACWAEEQLARIPTGTADTSAPAQRREFLPPPANRVPEDSLPLPSPAELRERPLPMPSPELYLPSDSPVELPSPIELPDLHGALRIVD